MTLGDVQSTDVQLPQIIKDSIYDIKSPEKLMVKGNVKAIIPLTREWFKVGEGEKYNKFDHKPLKEQRIFGIISKN